MWRRLLLSVFCAASIMHGRANVAQARDLVDAPSPSASFTVSSDAMAALLVAFEDQRHELRRGGVRLTPTTFASKYGVVMGTRDGDRIRIILLEPGDAPGGGVSYVIDAKSLRIISRVYGR
jgi:hypothetical protein